MIRIQRKIRRDDRWTQTGPYRHSLATQVSATLERTTVRAPPVQTKLYALNPALILAVPILFIIAIALFSPS